MKEDESNWFTNWEQTLPKPEDLVPLSQTLITPDLAVAFNIYNPHTHHQLQQQQPPELSQPNSTEQLDSSELDSSEPARTLKRPRLVWTPQLHKRFVDAVAQLGIKNAVPKTIMQLMGVDGLTRENVASHLQKYRLYLKRMQGLGSGGNGFGSGGDPVTDRLFASSPVPAHLLHQSYPGGSDGYLPYVPVAAIQQQQQQQQMVGQHMHRHFGSGFLGRQGVHMMGNPVRGYNVDDVEAGNEKRALSLFPVGDD